MSYVTVKCPWCGSKESVNVDFEEGPDHATFNDLECEKCEKMYGCELVSENIYCDSVWKADE